MPVTPRSPFTVIPPGHFHFEHERVSHTTRAQKTTLCCQDQLYVFRRDFTASPSNSLSPRIPSLRLYCAGDFSILFSQASDVFIQRASPDIHHKVRKPWHLILWPLRALVIVSSFHILPQIYSFSSHEETRSLLAPLETFFRKLYTELSRSSLSYGHTSASCVENKAGAHFPCKYRRDLQEVVPASSTLNHRASVTVSILTLLSLQIPEEAVLRTSIAKMSPRVKSRSPSPSAGIEETESFDLYTPDQTTPIGQNQTSANSRKRSNDASSVKSSAKKSRGATSQRNRIQAAAKSKANPRPKRVKPSTIVFGVDLGTTSVI